VTIQRKAFRATGRVQGVGFRATVAAEARRRGVRGWIRNERDRSVTGVAEGSGAELDALFAWCRDGVPGAIVDALEVSELGDATPLLAFEIR
jgi:acylphosphatase